MSASGTNDEESNEEESSAKDFAQLDVCSNQSNDSSIGNSENDEPLNTVTRKFLCKIRGQNRITGKAVQDIAVATDHLIQQMLKTVKRNVREVLHNADIGNDDFNDIESVFDEAAQEVQVLRTPLSETFSNRNDYSGVENIVS